MARWVRSEEKESFWREVMARHRAGGLSVRAFCRSENLKESSFHFWRRTLAARDGKKRAGTTRSGRPNRPTRVSFVPAMVRPLVPGAPFVLELAGGRVLKFPSSTTMANVAELVLALERGSDR